jgi:hypothetical protein
MKRLRTSGRARFVATAVAVGAFASLGGVGYAAGLVHFDHSSATNAQYPPSKVTICHHTHSQKNPFVTITVSEHALPAHLRHGDTTGACSEQQGSTAKHAKAKAPKKEHRLHKNRGHHGDKAHAGKPAKPTHVKGNHGQGNRGQSRGHAPSGVQANGHGKAKGHGHGQGQGQGHGHVEEHGHGQGHDPGGDHGNSGGGKGNGHKP